VTAEDAAERRAAIAVSHTAESRDERRRRMARERAARSRERKKEREQEFRAETREEDERESVTQAVAEQRIPESEPVRRTGSSNGKILGVFAVARPGNHEMGLSTTSEVLYSRGQRSETLSREQWLNMPREEPERPACLVTPRGRYSFFVTDEHDIARAAANAADDLPGCDEMALRETLSTVKAGSVFTVSPEPEPSAS
jgi:hypothetical protein